MVPGVMDNIDKITMVSAGINFALTVPVWIIIGWFISRFIKRRDLFEDNLNTTLKALDTTISDLDKSFNLQINTLDKRLTSIEKDLEYAKLMTKTVADIVDKTNKQRYDIDNCYREIRFQRDGSDKLESLVRERTHWTNDSLAKIIATLIKIHGIEGEVELGPMPR